MTQGGGGSDALSNSFMAKDVAHAFEEMPRDYNVRIVHLSHVIGSIRTDPMKEHPMATSGEVLYKMISGLPDTFGPGDNIVLNGISAGGGELIELGKHFSRENKLGALVLGDPAGIHENPDLIKNFALDPMRAFPDHYRNALTEIRNGTTATSRQDGLREKVRVLKQGLQEQTYAIKKGLKVTVAEVLAGMCTTEGKPNSLLDMARKQLGGAQIKYINSLAKQYEQPTLKAGIAISDMVVDATKDTREEIKCPVIFAPMIGLA